MRQFENWLIADPEAIAQIKNFKLTSTFRKRVAPDKADHVPNPIDLLNKLELGPKSFHKTVDGTEIAKKLDINTVASNSRSFRRFLRLLSHPDYLTQSKKPTTNTL